MTAAGLPALEARLKQDLAYLELPAKNWVPPRRVNGQSVHDVVVVGAGMCGLTAAAAMINLGIRNILVLDAAPAGSEGPWVTFARMRTLRSPKTLTGPALGLPSLTFRAYFEARFGAEAWTALGKIPRPLWMEYLVWYRHVLDLPVRNETRLTGLRLQESGLLELDVTTPAGAQHLLTRHLVLANGRDGLGGPFVPGVTQGIDRRFWAHSAEAIDFEALRGRAVGVVGAGASAMDNAATALETGAGSVELFARRQQLPRINKFTGIGSPGVVHGFAGLPDDWKWRFLHYAMSEQTPPPRDSTLRVSAHTNARLHLGSPVLGLEQVGDVLHVSTPKRRYDLDFLIFATGFRQDLDRRAEFAAFAPHIRLWQDRFSAPDRLDDEELATSPDLGPAFEFQERHPGACPMLKYIHCFNHHATLSHGKLAGDIPAVSDGAQRLAHGLAQSLFIEDRDLHYAALRAFDTPELLGDEWRDGDALPSTSGE